MTRSVFEASGLLRATSATALQDFLRRQRGVRDAEANPVSQTVTVHFDESSLTPDDVRSLIEAFGCGCGGEIVPFHLCRDEQPAVIGTSVPHREHRDYATVIPAGAAPAQGGTAEMAHGMGHGAGMSMDEMVRDMRNRFLVAFLLAIPVFLYSPLAIDVFGLELPTPFGMDPNLLLFVLSTPAVVWSGQMFFVGAWRSLRSRTLDMNVLVALSVGAGYLFSVGATFLFEAEVFYEASVVLLAFVLFGHWLEMRARAGASDATVPCSTSRRRGRP